MLLNLKENARGGQSGKMPNWTISYFKIDVFSMSRQLSSGAFLPSTTAICGKFGIASVLLVRITLKSSVSYHFDESLDSTQF